MTARQILKQWFGNLKKPTGGQFAELIDSYWHKQEDSIPISSVGGLSTTLAGKASASATADAIQNEADLRGGGDDALQAQIDELVAGGSGFNMTAYIQAAPVYNNEAAALAGGLASFTLYKTSTGELRYKLQNPTTPEPPTGGTVDDEADTFTYTGGEA